MLARVTYDATYGRGRIYTFQVPPSTKVGDKFPEEGVTVVALGSDYQGPTRSLTK